MLRLPTLQRYPHYWGVFRVYHVILGALLQFGRDYYSCLCDLLGCHLQRRRKNAAAQVLNVGIVQT